jgi:O-antigen ligase
MAIDRDTSHANVETPRSPGMSRLGSVAVVTWQGFLFGGMALLCVWATVASAMDPAANISYLGPLYVVAALAAWHNPVSAVVGFIVAVPLLNGIAHTTSGLGGDPYNTLFSGIYLAWFIKRVVVHRTSVYPSTSPALLADILSTAVLCSLLVLLLGYPRSEAFPEAFRSIARDQRSFAYCIYATTVFMQGLFLYRLLDLESARITTYQHFAWAILAISTIVVAFALFQLVFDVPAWRSAPVVPGLLLPFDDIHSFGSTIVLLFSVSLFMLHDGHGSTRITYGIAVFLMAWCAVFSLSRATWGALFVVVVAYAWQLRWKQALTATVGIVAVSALAVFMVQQDLYLKYIPFSRSLSSLTDLRLRRYIWQIPTDMVHALPLSGVGIGSFVRMFSSYTNPEHFAEGTIPAAGNAHNYFLQLAAELGLPALAVFLVLLVCVYRSAFARLRAEPAAKPFVKGLMVGVGAYLITCLTGHPLLLPAQQFIFWFAIAALTITPGHAQEVGPSRFGRLLQAGLAVLCVAMALGYAHRAYALPTSIHYRYGVYFAEQWGAERIEWTNREAQLQVEATSDVIGFKVYTNSRNIGPNGLALTVAVDGKTLGQRTLFSSGPHEFSYYVPGIAKRTAVVRFSVSHTFNPREIGMSQDDRDLGVALAPITFLPQLPPEGVGFHEWETLKTDVLPVALPESTVPFRWTQQQATIPLRGRDPSAALTVLLCVSHPDVRIRPVSVELRGDGRVLRTVTFNDTAWKQIDIPAAAIRGAQALTLRVDRTWNPRLATGSQDTRDLGVGVILR